MGNVQSGAVYRKLDKEIPPWTNMSGYYTTWHEVGQKVFVDNKDREQFICTPETLQYSQSDVYC